MSSSQGNLNSTQIMMETSNYPASASREMPLAMSTRGQNIHNSRTRGLRSTSPHHSGAAPLSVRKLKMYSSPFPSARTQPGDGAYAVKGSATGAPAGSYAASVKGPASTIRGPAGSTYVVRGAQHPRYTRTSHGNTGKEKTKLFKSPSSHPTQHRTTPPSSTLDVATVPLIISSENNTVRGLHSGTVNTAATATTAAPTHPAKRRSIIESIAVATGLESTNQASNKNIDDEATRYPPKAEEGNQVTTASCGHATVRFLLDSCSDSGAGRTDLHGSCALGPLGLQDAMKMRLQQPPSNVLCESSLAQQRLPADALVMGPPDKTKDGKDNAMYAQLSAFKMPQEGGGADVDGANNKEMKKALTTAETAGEAVGNAAATAAAPTTASPANVSQPGATTTTSFPPPQPPSAAPTAAEAEKANKGQPYATTAVAAPLENSALPVLHASLREPTSEEKAVADTNHLLNDLIHSAAEYKSSRTEPEWLRQGERPDAQTEAGMIALYVQHQIDRNRGFYGWKPPPANVLLPDPSQPEVTWTVLPNASSQEAQQAAASQVFAASGDAAGVTRKHANTVAANVRDGSTEAVAVRCADYHAPFQEVLRPESVEHLSAISDASGVLVDKAAEVHGQGDDKCDGHFIESMLAQDSRGTTVKSLASQAVILRDPLSLLACEHLASDTVDMVARRRAYLTAMTQLDGVLREASAPEPKSRPPIIQSILQPASPPGEVFCELSYQAKVLLSAVLYMRALGALPTLLRVGPLTEYSPIIDKENCIELVFYNPSDEEREQQELQEVQQDRRRRQSLERRRSSAAAVGVTTLYNQTPLARAHFEVISPMNAARRRARSQQPLPSREVSPGSRPASALRSRSRSLSVATSARNRVTEPNSTEDAEELNHPFSNNSYVRRSSLPSGGGSIFSPLSPDAQSQPSQQQQSRQRQMSAVEGLLMQSLSNVAMRRSGSNGIQPATISFNEKAPLTGAGLTSFAGPLLPSAEPSFLLEDTTEVTTPASCLHRRPTFYNENGGTWLRRSPSMEVAPYSHLHIGPLESAETQRNNTKKRSASVPCNVVQRLRRGSECCSGARSAVVPHISREEKRMTAATARRVPSPAATSPPTTTVESAPQPNVFLRRSSVQFAVEALKSDAGTEKPASLTLASSFAKLGGSSSFSPPAQKSATFFTPPLHRSVQFESPFDAVTAPRTASDARTTKPVPPRGAGASRFPAGERELCVVLRAVVAQKSLVYAFGKSETVHVLPPLPPRTIDDLNEDALVLKQVQQKRNEMNRLLMDTSSPLVKFLSGSGLRKAGNAEAEEKEAEMAQRVSLRQRARRVAAAARRGAPVPVDAAGQPLMDDYGDLVVAFVLSKNASELSGSVPDMMELETLRYRIFSLQGYSTSDPSGIHAVRATGKAAAATEKPTTNAASLSESPSRSPQPPLFASSLRAPARDFSSFDSGYTHLQNQLSSYTAFQNNASPMTMPDQGALSLEASFSMEPSIQLSRAHMRSLKPRKSFFEMALRRTDPAYTQGHSHYMDRAYMSDADLQLLHQRQQQQRRALMQTRYPLYRASSVAESTLEAFRVEAKASVEAARCRKRPGKRGDVNGNANDESKKLLTGLGNSAVAAHVGGDPSGDDATAALQEAERDLLRFRPMNLNSFHRELMEAVQYAVDLQNRQKTERILHAFHM